LESEILNYNDYSSNSEFCSRQVGQTSVQHMHNGIKNTTDLSFAM